MGLSGRLRFLGLGRWQAQGEVPSPYGLTVASWWPIALVVVWRMGCVSDWFALPHVVCVLPERLAAGFAALPCLFL